MIIFLQKLLKPKTAFVLGFFLLPSFFLKAQQVTEVVTDFGGYWRSSSTANNATYPNNSHNVLAFKTGTQLYSTGVNDATLTSQAVSYTAGNYKALPINSITGTITSGSPIYIALGGNYDGVTSGFSSPLPAVKMKDVLADGINGLNIGTGVTNVPATATMTFAVQSVDVNSISDSKPDVLYSQIADPSTTSDVLFFANSSGTMIGNSITVTWSSVPSLGTYTLDLYNLQTGAVCDAASITSGFNASTTRNIRLLAFKLSDFGITAANSSSVASLIINPGGTSDPAFVAYNSDAFVIIPPAITSQPQSKVVCAGTNQSATFSVTATGSNDTYQWTKNGVNIPGATSSTYTINPVAASDAGTYQVIVSNNGGTVTSDKAYLNTSITTQPSSQTIVTGNTVTLSISATNADSYQWKKNGVDIPGATASVYTISPLNTTDGGSYTVSAINSTNNCATVLSNQAVITPAIVVYSKSAPDINLPSTWGANTDGSGSTPVDFTRSEHTFVFSNRSSGNTLTNLAIAGTFDVKDGVAIIADNSTLDVGSCIRTGTGSITGSSSSGLTVSGNSDLYFTLGSQLLKNFTVTGGTVNMLSDLTISGGLLPGKLNLTGGTLALGGNKITIQSTSTTNTSMVTAVGATAGITYGSGGAFIVERFIPGKRAYRFISPAATTTTSVKSNWMEGVVNPDRWTNYDSKPGYGTHITGPRTAADSLDVTQTYNPSLFTFDKTAQQWKPVANSAGTLTAGSPYRFMIRGSRAVNLNNNEATPSNTIIRTTGQLTIGNFTVNSTSLSTTVGGYSFVGNPYACPVDWKSLSRSGISSSYYGWDEKLNSRGAYVSYNALSETNSSSASAMDHNIQSEQAFFVQSTSTNPSITFTEATKSHTNTAVFRGASTMTKLSVQLLLSLNGGSHNVADGFTAVYNNRFSETIGDEDSYKFPNLDENISIDHRGTDLSIEGRPMIKEGDTLAIKMSQFRQKDYWVKIDGYNFSPSLNAVLKDEYLKQESPVDLTSSTIIPFTITADPASSAPKRFSILFESYATLPVALTDVKAFKKDKGIQVEWQTATETSVLRYEVEKSLNSRDFEKVYAGDVKGNHAEGNSYSWFDDKTGSADHFYRIKTVEKNGDAKYSEVVRVNISNDKDRFLVFPNPVKGNVISFQLRDGQTGEYEVSLYNSAGQKLYGGSLNAIGRAITHAIRLDQRLTKGNYTLQVKNEKKMMAASVLAE